MHISALSEKFVKDPYEVVKAGDIVKVKVMEVDIPRKRVALSMRMSDVPGEKPAAPVRNQGPRPARHESRPTTERTSNSATSASGTMAALFANAKQRKK